MEYSSFPVLVVDDDLKADTAAGRAARAVIGALKEHGLSVIEAATYDDGEMVLHSNPGIGCLMLEWGCNGGDGDGEGRALDIIGLARSRGSSLPIFVVTNRVLLAELPYDALHGVTGYMWKLEDTPHFIAGRVSTPCACTSTSYSRRSSAVSSSSPSTTSTRGTRPVTPAAQRS